MKNVNCPLHRATKWTDARISLQVPGVFDNNGNVGNVLFSHNGDPKTCNVWAIDQALTPIGSSEEFV